MNRAQFKDPVPHLCLAGAGAVSWSLVQEMAGLSPFYVITNILVTEFMETFRENSNDQFVPSKSGSKNVKDRREIVGEKN